MHKYTIISITSFILYMFFVLFFDIVSSLTGDMFPFVSVLSFGLLTLISVVLRGSVWYRKDLAKRTLDELERLEKEEKYDESKSTN